MESFYSDDITFNILEQLAASGDYVEFTKFLNLVKKPSKDLLKRVSNLEHPLTFIVRIGTNKLTGTRYDKFMIPFEQATRADIKIDWGDSYVTHYKFDKNLKTPLSSEHFHVSHTYDDVSRDKFVNYKVRVYGLLNHLGTSEYSRYISWCNNIVEFVSLGKIGIISLNHLFHKSTFNRPISHLDVSEIINARSMFESNTSINQDVFSMNFSSLISMDQMFNGTMRLKKGGDKFIEDRDLLLNAPLTKPGKNQEEIIKNRQRIAKLNKIWNQQFGSAVRI